MTADPNTVAATGPITGVDYGPCRIGEADYLFARAGGGNPLLLLHGFPETYYCWRALIPALAQSHMVVAPDLRGYGGRRAAAGGPRGEGFSLRKIIGVRTKFSASQNPSAPVTSTAPTLFAVGPRSRDGPDGRNETATEASAAAILRGRGGLVSDPRYEESMPTGSGGRGSQALCITYVESRTARELCLRRLNIRGARCPSMIRLGWLMRLASATSSKGRQTYCWRTVSVPTSCWTVLGSIASRSMSRRRSG
jgi:alpha/beta hydrolase fold